MRKDKILTPALTSKDREKKEINSPSPVRRRG
jgi:hypothetical protein